MSYGDLAELLATLKAGGVRVFDGEFCGARVHIELGVEMPTSPSKPRAEDPAIVAMRRLQDSLTGGPSLDNPDG